MQNRKSRMGKGLGSAAAASGSQLRKLSAQKLELLRERALLVEQKDRLQAVQGTVRDHGRGRRGDLVGDESQSWTTCHFSSCRSQGEHREEWEPA